MKRIAEIILVVLAAAIPSASLAGKQEGRPAAAGTTRSFTGRVDRVIDGDTIVVGTNIVRLAEIDAPEMKAPHGPASRRALRDLILHRQVTVNWTRRGRYRRIIGQVYLDGEWINLSMVAKGWARQFKRYSRSQGLAVAQTEAAARGCGMWARANSDRE
jgi:endonuclease YncB( thermonuclease family)